MDLALYEKINTRYVTLVTSQFEKCHKLLIIDAWSAGLNERIFLAFRLHVNVTGLVLANIARLSSNIGGSDL